MKILTAKLKPSTQDPERAAQNCTSHMNPTHTNQDRALLHSSNQSGNTILDALLHSLSLINAPMVTGRTAPYEPNLAGTTFVAAICDWHKQTASSVSVGDSLAMGLFKTKDNVLKVRLMALPHNAHNKACLMIRSTNGQTSDAETPPTNAMLVEGQTSPRFNGADPNIQTPIYPDGTQVFQDTCAKDNIKDFYSTPNCETRGVGDGLLKTVTLPEHNTLPAQQDQELLGAICVSDGNVIFDMLQKELHARGTRQTFNIYYKNKNANNLYDDDRNQTTTCPLYNDVVVAAFNQKISDVLNKYYNLNPNTPIDHSSIAAAIEAEQKNHCRINDDDTLVVTTKPTNMSDTRSTIIGVLDGHGANTNIGLPNVNNGQGEPAKVLHVLGKLKKTLESDATIAAAADATAKTAAKKLVAAAFAAVINANPDPVIPEAAPITQQPAQQLRRPWLPACCLPKANC